MKRNKILESKILARIIRKKSTILLREDFLDLGGYDQIGRALKQLADKGKVVRIGYGLYCKTRISALTGETVLAAPLTTLAKEALKRLGVQVIPSNAEIAYNEGRSTQVPTGRLIGVKARVSRKIGYKGAYIHYEYISPEEERERLFFGLFGSWEGEETGDALVKQIYSARTSSMRDIEL